VHKIAATLVILLAGLAAGQDNSSKIDPDHELRLSLPLWIPGFHGDATVRGRERDVDVGFVRVIEALPDIVDAMDSALLGEGEFRFSRYLFRGSFITADLSGSGEVVPGLLSLNGKMELDTVRLEIGYRALDLPLGGGDSDSAGLHLTVDALAGIRWNRLSGMLEIGRARRGTSRILGDEVEWVDGIYGARAILTSSRLPAAWLSAEGHLGGGGARFTWDAEATLGYRFWDHLSVSAGWRAYGVDYHEYLLAGPFALDLVIHGPILRLGVDF